MKSSYRLSLFRLWPVLFAVALVAGFFYHPVPTQAAVPAGYAEYYIPISTDQAFRIFQDIDNDPELGNAFGVGTCATGTNECNEMHSIISLSLAANNVTVYYDHWENGYGTGSTGIDETYTGDQGDVLIFESSSVIVPRAAGNTCTSTNPSGTSAACYDGRDRIYVAGGTPTTVYAVYPEGNNIDTVFALAWEIYPVKPYLTSYTIPVGEDLVASQGYNDFNQTFVTVQATANNTNIQIDDPNTAPSPDVNTTINRGQVTQLFHFAAGTTVLADNPVQVQFVVGQPHANAYSESRGYTAVPSGLWNYAYYNPVSSLDGTHNTEVYIYNPTGSNLNITYEDNMGTGNFNVPGNTTRSFTALSGHTLPVGSALYLEATDGTTNFWAIGSGGTANSTGNTNADYDYGFSLVPANLLKDDYFISWAPGTTNYSANGSPLWVTPIEDDTTIFVDYSPTDGTADVSYTLDRIQIQKIFDPDNNNTGMHIWATNPIAVVWGEDAININSPYIDVGYTSLPLPPEWIDIVLLLDKTADPEIIPDLAGQTSEFTLVVSTDTFAVDDVVVTDTLPANWSYVSGSTTITLPDNSTISGGLAEPGTSGQDLIWNAFPSGPLDMLAGETLTIVFTAQTTATPGGTSVNNAETTGTHDGLTFTAVDSATVEVSVLEIEKISRAGGGYVYPGDTITYTIVITNTGTATQNNIVVNDTVPVGTTFVSGTVDGYTGSSAEYRDDFMTGGGYSQSSGVTDWSTQSWDENGDDDSATGGTIQITGNELRFLNPNGDSIQRAIPDDFTGMPVFMDIDYRETGTWDVDDDFWVEMWNGAGWRTIIQRTDDFGDPAAQTGIDVGAICAACLNANPQIRLRSDIDANEYLYIDYVRIYYNDVQPVSGAAINTPPNIIQSSDGYLLESGETMTITYLVRVDDPVAFGLTSIDNTVQVSSDEEPTPLEDNTSDPLPFASIGNYVWLDENGDGVQDTGESGIPNVVIELYDADGTLVMTATTDSNGGYLFDNVVISAYTVTVRTSSMPAGLAANPTYDEDGGTSSPDAETLVTLTSNNQEYMTADFGFNWTSVIDVTSPSSGATGAIGDRIWNDADGDGIQDPGEAGISGVTVSLLVDSNGDGIFGGTGDAAPVTTTTNAAGNYIFDDLPAGAYVVSVTAPGGYTQTGDPDESGTCTTCDNQTTTPIVLAPGDVYVNADFGYQPSGTTNTIGNQIFVDLNGDGNLDGGEPGIPGVTVALLDGSGNVIATTVTNASGQYSFTGLPDGTYTIWVNDTNNVLGELTQNSTPNNTVDGGQPCGTCNGRNTVTVSGGAGNNYQDFGYAPADHDNGDGLIGDTIFIDRDGGNDYDPGEGLEGVVVWLYDSSGTTLLATTTTDENGNYYFGGLPAGDYVVRVDTGTLPAGVTNTVDPDGGTASESDVSLADGEIDLAQDFGYRDTSNPNTISGTIWNDSNADGTLTDGTGGTPDETVRGFGGVTVVLRNSNGNIVATTITASDGSYSFTNLPDGTYTVDVTDENNVLNGYWHSTGGSPGSDNNSQSDPYSVTVSGGATNTTADFGYYVDPAVVGDYVWLDVNEDGVQDLADEPPIPNAEVRLTITYPNSSGSITLVTYTDENGYYSFGNLLLDENYNGDGAGLEPTFTIDFTAYGQTPSPTGQSGADTDSNGLSTSAAPVQGQTDNSYDSGFFGHIDLGDLPYDGAGSDPDYPTLFSPGPAHLVFPTTNNVPTTTNGIPAVWLGLIVDTEANGQPNLQATGDDSSGVDDEDGLTFAQNGYITGAVGVPITVTINASEAVVTVYYGLWIDWNADGDFTDPDDGFYQGSGSSGSPTDVVVSINVPGSYVQDSPVYFRVRASDRALSANDFEGTFINGEVEDYGRAFFGPTAIQLKDFSTQNKPLVLGWMAVAVALMVFPVVVILRRRRA